VSIEAGAAVQDAPAQPPTGWLLAAVVAVLCVAIGATDVAFGLRNRHADSLDTARTAAVNAAQRAVRDILSYDYRTLDTDIARAKSETTGLFAREYAGTASTLLAEAKQLRAIVQATPAAPAIVTASADDVVVLVFVDQASVKQPAGQKSPATRIDQSRVRMALTKVGNTWKVSQLAAL
jgi:Mce-associated membrane protein